MKNCPHCLIPVDGLTCPGCGYSEDPNAPQPRNSGKALDPSWWQCANIDHGQRCANPGAIAHGTMGSGPYYCQGHAFPQRSNPTAPAQGFRALRDILHKARPLNSGEWID